MELTPGNSSNYVAGNSSNSSLPPRYLWSLFWGGSVHLVGLRQLILWAGALGGLVTLLVMAPCRRPYAYILVAVLACSLPYVLVQPTLRYRYTVSSLLFSVRSMERSEA